MEQPRQYHSDVSFSPELVVYAVGHTYTEADTSTGRTALAAGTRPLALEFLKRLNRPVLHNDGYAKCDFSGRCSGRAA